LSQCPVPISSSDQGWRGEDLIKPGA
jgi:hypothetical protein